MARYLKLTALVAYGAFAMPLSSLAAASAPAAPDDGVPFRKVNFADLDLTTGAGAATLYGRIKSAARAVCLSENARSMEFRMFSDRCRSQAVGRAVADVGAPALTTYHQAHTKPTVKQ